MRLRTLLAMLAICGATRAQRGQEATRPGWPCVAGRAVDPAYIELSESTGGQLFLFQKGEAAQAGPVMSAPFTHPATVLRAVGHLSGARDYDFPVDAGIRSLLVLVSVQCRESIRVSRPSGAEATATNSAQDVQLAAGRILRIEAPEPGRWRVRLAGTGLFVLMVLAKADLAVTETVRGADGRLEIRVRGEHSRLAVQLVDASGGLIAELPTPEAVEEGVYRTGIAAEPERYRIVVTGVDGSAWPFQRMFPVLFRCNRPK